MSGVGLPYTMHSSLAVACNLYIFGAEDCITMGTLQLRLLSTRNISPG